VGDKQRFSSYLVGDLLVGIKVDSVQEVTTGLVLTPVPLAPPLVAGLLNLRGQIVTAIDLRRCLQLQDRPADQQPVNLILRTNDGNVGLLADEIGEVVEVDSDDFEVPPRTVRGRLRELITGTYKLDGGLLLVLDTEAALAFSAGKQA